LGCGILLFTRCFHYGVLVLLALLAIFFSCVALVEMIVQDGRLANLSPPARTINRLRANAEIGKVILVWSLGCLYHRMYLTSYQHPYSPAETLWNLFSGAIYVVLACTAAFVILGMLELVKGSGLFEHEPTRLGLILGCGILLFTRCFHYGVLVLLALLAIFFSCVALAKMLSQVARFANLRPSTRCKLRKVHTEVDADGNYSILTECLQRY
jgi:hypothetical protein